MAGLNHLHTYERVGQRGGNPRYRCIDPDCTHWIKYDMLVGKRAACGCGTPMILTHEILRAKHPRCDKCCTGKRHEKWVARQLARKSIASVVRADDNVYEIPLNEGDIF